MLILPFSFLKNECFTQVHHLIPFTPFPREDTILKLVLPIYVLIFFYMFVYIDNCIVLLFSVNGILQKFYSLLFLPNYVFYLTFLGWSDLILHDLSCYICSLLISYNKICFLFQIKRKWFAFILVLYVPNRSKCRCGLEHTLNRPQNISTDKALKIPRKRHCS